MIRAMPVTVVCEARCTICDTRTEERKYGVSENDISSYEGKIEHMLCHNPKCSKVTPVALIVLYTVG